MAGYTLSNRAAEDLSEIYRYSHERFGEAKADAYLSGLEEAFQTLAERPGLGRSVSEIRSGYLHFQYVRHSIYFKLKEGGGLYVVRVLHSRMDAGRHL